MTATEPHYVTEDMILISMFRGTWMQLKSVQWWHGGGYFLAEGLRAVFLVGDAQRWNFANIWYVFFKLIRFRHLTTENIVGTYIGLCCMCVVQLLAYWLVSLAEMLIFHFKVFIS